MNGVIDSLKTKVIPNPPKPFIVKAGVQEGNKQNMSRADPMSNAGPMSRADLMSRADPMNVNVEQKPNMGFKIIDKRDANIDRKLVLERFRQQLPDINKSLLATTNMPMREASMRDIQPQVDIANKPTEAPMRDTQPQVDIANKPTEAPMREAPTREERRYDN